MEGQGGRGRGRKHARPGVFTVYGLAAVNDVGEGLGGDESVRFWTSAVLKLEGA